tara:strand:- start:382 stop:606 length:225 start_codon:yes stop_codon:yes gene_type:complete
MLTKGQARLLTKANQERRKLADWLIIQRRAWEKAKPKAAPTQRRVTSAMEAMWEADQSRWDDDPNPYEGTYSEE